MNERKKDSKFPKELRARREKVNELYDKGYGILDISRYFEVPSHCIRKSLLKMSDLLEGGNVRLKSENLDISAELIERDNSLSMLSVQNIRTLGFWAMPKEFALHDPQDIEQGLLRELRMVGLNKEEIAFYMGFSSVLDVPKIRKEQSCDFCNRQIKLVSELKKADWSYKEIIEFCGISLTKIYKNQTYIDGKSPLRMAQMKETEEKYREIYFDYKENENMTHRELASKYNISRGTVIKAIKCYQNQHPELSPIQKRKSSGNNGNIKTKSDEIIASLLQGDYLSKDSTGKYINAKSFESIAKDFDVTEKTISKCIKRINEENKKHIKESA